MSCSGEGSPPGLPLLPDRPQSPRAPLPLPLPPPPTSSSTTADCAAAPPLDNGDGEAAGKSGGRVANKICRVCGDRALGYNFNVVSCESCKAFFRRNALNNKEFRCPFSGDCHVNVISRRMCQRCRLRKCFEVGMKSDWILSEDAKKKKRPRKRAADSLSPSARSQDEEAPSTSKPKTLKPDPAKMSALVASDSGAATSAVKVEVDEGDCGEGSVRVPKALLLKLLESHGRASGRSACSCSCLCGFYPKGARLGPPPLDARNTETILSCLSQGAASSSSSAASPGKVEFSNMGWIPADLAGVEPAEMGEVDLIGSMINATISAEMSGSPPGSLIPPSPLTPGTPSGGGCPPDVLSPRDQRKLEELIAANEVMNESGLDDERLPKNSLTLTDVVNLTDVAVRKIIQMSKKIAGFRSLNQEDQIALLKGSCTEVMILRGLMNYDAEKEVWKGPGPQEISCDVLKDIKGGDAYLQHKRYLSSFAAEWRTNEPLMLLLSVITLFTPSRPFLTNPAYVQQQQDSYHALLQRFLRSSLPQAQAETTYRQLCHRIHSLHSLNETLQNIFLHVNPKDVEPLLIEIFDLKK